MAFRMLQRATGLLVLLTLSFWCLSADSSDISNTYKPHIVEEVTIVHREEANATPLVSVLGIGGLGSDTIHPRLEIRELERRPDEFNIFLLGLQRFQNASQDNKLSYFQVAGKETLFTK
jgi:tyrosinase